MTNLTTADHLAQALAAYGNPNDERLGEIVRAAISHIYAFVEEVGLTREEWFAGIDFLTATGQMCDEQRQEFILLSDTLGVSMLVEMVNQQGADGTTEPTVFGPFHVEGAPLRAMGESIATDIAAPALTFSGVVRGLDGNPIEGAELDVWQNAPNGLYDVQDAAVDGMDMRGRFVTGADGRYEFSTIRPIAYKIPDDGPVGRMVQLGGRHPWRPAHTHVMLDAPGHKRIITHLFDAASDYLDSDIVFGVRDSLIVDMSGGTVSYDFVLESN